MSLPEVYLHAVGMLNALGDDVDAIARALAAGQSPGMQTISTLRGERFVGRVRAPLAQPLDAMLAAAFAGAPDTMADSAFAAVSAATSVTTLDGARAATGDAAVPITSAVTSDAAHVAMSAAVVDSVCATASAAVVDPARATSSAAVVDPACATASAAAVDFACATASAAAVDSARATASAATVDPVRVTTSAATVDPARATASAAAVDPGCATTSAAMADPARATASAATIDPARATTSAATVASARAIMSATPDAPAAMPDPAPSPARSFPSDSAHAFAPASAFASALAPFDCRNNRLLFAALAQIAPAIEAARERYGSHRIGVVLGTSTSGVSAAEAALTGHRATGMLPASLDGRGFDHQRLDHRNFDQQRFDYRSMEIGTVAPFAARALGLGGPAFTVSTACTSSARALVSARRLLQYGLCDAVITGGVDTLCELTLQGFGALESLSPARANPMSRNRRGINVGEGAAVFLLSREKAPVALVGAGESSDAYHISAPDPQGAGGERALRAALADARLAATDIGYVNLHATATPKNDQMEARLMARVFPAGVAASGTKPLTGHMLGAAGAAEIGLAWIVLTRAACPLPVHLWDGEADPELPPLDLVSAGRYLSGAPGARYVMSNSFAFGGSNVSLILRG